MRALLLLSFAPACVDYDLSGKDENVNGAEDSGADTVDTDTEDGSNCAPRTFEVAAVAPNDACDFEVGGFEPVVEWGVEGKWSTALPVVGDLDGDGLPEIVVVWSGVFGGGTLAAYHGDGSGRLWELSGYNIGYGSPAALADLDDDGVPEILVVLDNGYPNGYSVAAFDPDGQLIWQSMEYTDNEFNHATGLVVSDMEHDGDPEIVAGRVILNSDGSQQAEGRGSGIGLSAGGFGIYEGAHPAVADLDLDGVEEVITGNYIYGPDGTALRRSTESDGAVAVANLDGDPEGEYVVTIGNEIRAHDTDASLLWGPMTNPSANIFPVPAIGDIDGDGEVEIIVAGGNELWALNADGSELWTARVTDESGATGASIFDFDADGVPEVVYIDEVQMVAYNGTDGRIKFQSDEHSSATMYDYPVVADVDGDDHTEIIIASEGRYGLAVFEDATNSWAPARDVWNQHAYTITNINDDLSVPTNATPNFTIYNNYHCALAMAPGESIGDELEAELLDVCEDDCGAGVLRVWARGLNSGNGELPAGVKLALFGTPDDVLLGVAETSRPTPALESTEAVEFAVDAALLDGVTGLEVRVDDDGTGTGAIAECVETNNGFRETGSWCD
jgi:hypothetical protein